MLSSGCVLMPYCHVHNEEGVFLFSAHDLDARWKVVPAQKDDGQAAQIQQFARQERISSRREFSP